MVPSPLRVPQEKEALLEEGFEREAEALQEQIQRLQEEEEEMKKPSWIEQAMEGLGVAANVLVMCLLQLLWWKTRHGL